MEGRFDCIIEWFGGEWEEGEEGGTLDQFHFARLSDRYPNNNLEILSKVKR